MGSQSALGAIKRRWWIVLLIACAGTIIGALPEPRKVEDQERTFSATHTLLINDATAFQSANSVISPSQLTLFVTTGEVPIRAAESLGFAGNAASLARSVTSDYDFETGALTITTTQDSAEQAERIADALAEELTSYIAERQDVIYQDRVAASLERLSDLEGQLGDLTRTLAARPDDPVLQAQQSAVSRQYSVAFEQSELLSSAPPVLGFTTLQRAQGVEITDRGLGAPTSRTSRAFLGAVVGVALGAAAAVVLGRLDRRIRTREQAEEVMELRSRVVIPKVRDPGRDQLVVAADRRDTLSDAYRTVRNIVEFIHTVDGDRSRGAVTLVVSPGPGDGKTSLTANLAAATAESGRETVLVNADFRIPRLGTLFPEATHHQLPFGVREVGRRRATDLLATTRVERLHLLDLSPVDGSAGELVRATAEKLRELTEVSDSVIIDTSPVGATAEVLELVPHADVIVIVARVGHTRVADAQRSVAILRDLTTAPIVLVLGGLRSDRSSYYEYGRKRPPAGASVRRWLRPHVYDSSAPDEPVAEVLPAAGDEGIADQIPADEVAGARRVVVRPRPPRAVGTSTPADR
jgi:Mrp family chromosome partitioning ATPase